VSNEKVTDREGLRPAFGPRLLGAVVVIAYFAFLIRSFFVAGWVSDLMKNHYAFFVGVPASAIVAYVLVSVLETTRGKVEFEAVGFKFKGASGPIVLWVIVFLALVIAIRLTWPL
jgi:hypothetical protein